MNDNQFDEFFRSKFEKFASDVPDDMWQRINKQDKDRKGFFIPRWYWFALLLLLIGIGGYFALNNNIAPGKIENRFAKSKDADENKSQEKILNKENKTIDSVTVKINQDSYPKLLITRTNNSKKENTKTNIRKILNDNNSSPSATQNFTIDTEFLLKDHDDKSGNATLNKNNKGESSNNKNSIAKKTETDSSAIADENNKDPKKDDDTRDKFSLELFINLPPSIAFNNIHSENGFYEKQLKDASKIRYVLSVGARLDLKITKTLSGKIGAHYILINEKINTTSDSLMAKISSSNFYKSLDVPILFSYTTNIKSNFNASVTSGIILNISSTYKGTIPDSYGGTADIKTGNVYNRNNGLSIYLGAGLSKNVKKKLDVFLQPYFIYRTKSMTSNLQPFDRKINTLGIEYGIRYKLFKSDQ